MIPVSTSRLSPIPDLQENKMVNALDPGKLRGMRRVTSSDGFFLICALDHLSDFAELLAPDPATVSFGDVVAAKDAIIRAVAPSVSAVLLDPLYGLGHLVATGAVPGNVGLMSSIEDEDYTFPEGARRTRFRKYWSAKRIKMSGRHPAAIGRGLHRTQLAARCRADLVPGAR